MEEWIAWISLSIESISNVELLKHLFGYRSDETNDKGDRSRFNLSSMDSNELMNSLDCFIDWIEIECGISCLRKNGQLLINHFFQQF